MDSMSANQKLHPLFESWRSYWLVEPSLVTLLDRLDQLRTTRSRGNFKLPSAPALIDKVKIFETFSEIEASFTSSDPTPLDQLVNWKSSLGPVINLERWGRWLHLEHSLEIASRTGDLLFAALVLRSMGEEVLRLLVLEFPAGSSRLVFKDSLDACAAWRAGVLFAIEPVVRSHKQAVEKDGAQYFARAMGAGGASEIIEVIKSLNDYVHPNFGSHVLAAFPEESNAAKPLLEAASLIYEAFLDLSWTVEEQEIAGVALPDPYVTSIPKIAWRLQNRIIPLVAKELGDTQSDMRVDGDAFIKWLLDSEQLALTLPGLDANDLVFFESLAPLLAGGNAVGSMDIKARLLLTLQKDAFPLRTRGGSFLRELSVVRFADAHLTTTSNSSSAFPAIGSTDWLKFVAHAVHLAISVSMLKLDMLVAQTAYQLAGQNQLGAVICVRSMLEHLAAVRWLIGRLESSWDNISKRVSSGELSESHLKQIDKALADFLTGSRGGVENDRDWSNGWASAGQNGLGLMQMVDASFGKSSNLSTLYDITSAMVHGRIMRGVEVLSTPRESRYLFKNLSRALFIVDHICQDDIQLDLRSRCLRMTMRLKNVAGAMTVEPHSAQLLERATLSMGTLKPGKHYLGTGTKGDPYRFRVGIPYYEAFYKICPSLGLDPTKRRSAMIEGRLLDEVDGGSESTYFLPPHED